MLYYTPICGRGEVLRALGANLRRRSFALDLVDYQGGVVATKPTTPPGTGWWPLVVLPGCYAGRGTPDHVARACGILGVRLVPAKKTFGE